MKLDRISGIILSVLGAGVMLWVIKSYPIGTLKEPGGGFFPLLGAVALLGLSLLVTFQSFIKTGGQESPDVPFLPGKEALKRIVSVFIAIVAYRYLLPVIGFAPVTGLFIFTLSKFLAHYSWKTSLLIAATTAIVAYYLFQVLLKVPMPVPMITFLSF
jgi:putative tricarboxylic transport membrane protein